MMMMMRRRRRMLLLLLLLLAGHAIDGNLRRDVLQSFPTSVFVDIARLTTLRQ